MPLLPSAFRQLLAPGGTRRRAPRHLHLETLEIRQVLTGSPATVPFTIVNNETIDSSGTLAYSDSEIYVALYAKDFVAQGDSETYYYFDQTGAAHTTQSVAPNGQGVQLVPTFTLNQLTKTGDHTYVINLPEVLPTGAGYGINSARVYFSMDVAPSLVINGDGSVTAPTPNDSYFDFFEFTLNAPNNPTGNLNIDTTNVDQFGVPIQIQVASSDPGNIPGGVGISATRESVLSQYQTFSAGTPFALCIWPTSGSNNGVNLGKYRILNPSGVLASSQVADSVIQVGTVLQLPINATTTTINVYSGQGFPDPASEHFNVQIDSEVMTVTAAAQMTNGTTNWTVVRGVAGTNAAPHNSGKLVNIAENAMSATQTTITVGSSIGYPASYPFSVLVDNEIMQVTGLNSNNKNGTTTWNVLRGQDGTTAAAHANGAMVVYNSVVSNPLNNYFDAAIDALFGKYLVPSGQQPDPNNELTVQVDVNHVATTFKGYVTQDAQGAYVLRFKTDGDPTDYDVYYPFFTDNQYLWATKGYVPSLTPVAAPSWSAGADFTALSPSDMVFSCNGVFADNTFRPNMNATQQTTLATLENKVVSALNRGVALLPGYTSSGAGSWDDSSVYYGNNASGQVWNEYAQFLHKSSVSIGGLNYGFAFDDQAGQASDIAVASFDSATITLSPWATGTPPSPPNPPDPPTPPTPPPVPPSRVSLRDFMTSNFHFPVSSSSGSPVGASQQSVIVSSQAVVSAPQVTASPQLVTQQIVAPQVVTQQVTNPSVVTSTVVTPPVVNTPVVPHSVVTTPVPTTPSTTQTKPKPSNAAVDAALADSSTLENTLLALQHPATSTHTTTTPVLPKGLSMRSLLSSARR